MRAFPARQIPNFKTPAPADERDLTFQAKLFANLFRQHETTLPVGYGMLGAGVKLARKNAAVAR